MLRAAAPSGAPRDPPSRGGLDTPEGGQNLLEAVDLNRTLSRARYQKEFPRLQERLRQLQYALKEAEIPTIVIFEGWDAAGKGSTIQRLTQRLDPRVFRAHPGAPPSELERRYHWLWRYEVRLPEDGHMALFDHSWYGRVLVERVEKYVKKKVWRDAYSQINEIERWLTDDGGVLVKLWFHISQAEQRKRFKKMEKSPLEQWKVEKEDWRRNRRYDDWVEAVEEMLAKTDTPHAPWTIVEATDGRWTRFKVFETLLNRMDQALAARREAPASVSRTQLAASANKVERARKAQEGMALVRSVAQDAGLPIEDS